MKFGKETIMQHPDGSQFKVRCVVDSKNSFSLLALDGTYKGMVFVVAKEHPSLLEYKDGK